MVGLVIFTMGMNMAKSQLYKTSPIIECIEVTNNKLKDNIRFVEKQCFEKLGDNEATFKFEGG